MTKMYKEDMNLMAYPNNFPNTAKGDYTFRVKTQSHTLTLRDIAAKVAQRIGKYSSGEIEMLTNDMMEAICEAVSSGYVVNTPMCLVQPCASGIVYKNELATQVDPAKVSVYASYTQGPAMRTAMKSVLTRSFIQPAITGPFIADFVSTAFRTDEPGTRASLGAGKMAIITGRGIKLMDAGNTVGSAEKVGITLTSVATPHQEGVYQPRGCEPQRAHPPAICPPHRGGGWRLDGRSDHPICQRRRYDQAHAHLQTAQCGHRGRYGWGSGRPNGVRDVTVPIS